MKNVTTKFLQDIQDNRNFSYIVTMNFANGVTKVLDSPNDLMSSGSEIKTSAETSSFPLGCAIGKTLTLCLPNHDERWSEYDFYGCDIKVELTHPSLDTPIVLGYFTVIEPETYGATVEIVGVDKMHKFDKPFNKASVSTPVTLMALTVEVCQQAQVSYQGAHFENDDFQITAIPDDLSCREVLGYIAMLAGGNAIINDYGTVSIVTYSMDRLYNQVDYNGGTFDTKTTPYSDGDNLSGGDFSFTDTDEISGGTFNELRDYHVLYKGSKITMSTDDVIITGVQLVIDKKVYPTNRTLTEGYILSLENPLLEGNDENSINTIMEKLNNILVFNDFITPQHPNVTGLKFRIFDIDHVSYPIVEFGDVTYVIDRKNREYKSIVTDVIFAFKGYTTIKCTAEPPARNSTKYQSAETRAIIATQELIETEKTERELAIQETQQMIANSSGLYETKTDHIDNLPEQQQTKQTNLKITFNPQCESEGKYITTVYDWCSFYVQRLGEYDVKAVFERVDITDYAGKSIVIPYDKEMHHAIFIFSSDSWNNKYGLKVDSIELTYDDVTNQLLDPIYYTSDNQNYTDYIYPSTPERAETPHPYESSKKYRIYLNETCFPTAPAKPMYYVLHNKPKMEESDIWWVASADVMYVSTDKGKTFNASLSADGNAIVNRLSAVGISADWIHTGEITIGGSGASATIVMRDTNNNVIGGWDAVNGLYFIEKINEYIGEAQGYTSHWQRTSLNKGAIKFEVAYDLINKRYVRSYEALPTNVIWLNSGTIRPSIYHDDSNFGHACNLNISGGYLWDDNGNRINVPYKYCTGGYLSFSPEYISLGAQELMTEDNQVHGISSIYIASDRNQRGYSSFDQTHGTVER